MAVFDVALGLDADALTQGSAQLYANPQARQKLFQGTRTGTLAGLSYTVGWDIRSAPNFLLAAPDQTHWQASITDQGSHPTAATPPADTFQLLLPELAVSFQGGSQPERDATAAVQIYGTVGIRQAGAAYLACLTPVSVWLDESALSGLDRFIVNTIIAALLQTAQTMLGGWTIPALTFSKQVAGVTVRVALAEPPVVAIDQGRLLLAACLSSRGQPVDLAGAQWPNQSLFALVSPGVLQDVLTQVATQLQGKQIQGSGNYKSLLTYDYQATVQALQLSADPADLTKLAVGLQASLGATLKPLGLGGPCAVGAAGSAL